MTPGRPGFRGDIEGLRGLAILLVVAFHAGVSRLAGGFVGVDVFFVLSGFFITGALAREVEQRGDVDLAGFYSRRAQRLLPAFFVVFFATLIVVLWLYAPIDQPSIAGNARWIAAHAGNVLFAQSALDYHSSDNNPLLHTWSLAVEQQFYLVWPLLFLWLGRAYGAAGATRRRMLTWVGVAGGLSFALCVWTTRVAQPWAFFGMPTRIWEFALGAAVMLSGAGDASEKSHGVAIQIVGLIAITIGVLAYHGATPYPGTAALLPALGAAALIVGGARASDGIVTRTLGAPLLRWFGRYSYAWYLWHWPLVGVGAVLDWHIGVAGKLAWSAVALVLAILTTDYVEEPIRRGELARLEAERVPLAALVATVAGVLIAHTAMIAAQHRASSPAQRVFAAARADAMQHDCWGTMLSNPNAACVFGDANARTTVMLLGDSHAEHWLPAVDRIGRERGWRVVAMIKPACPVADLQEFVSRRLKRHYTECGEFRRAMVQRIIAQRPALVILSSYDHYVAHDVRSTNEWNVTPAMWRDALRRTYSMLSAAGLRTVVIRDVPDAGFDAPACLSRRAAQMPFAKPCVYTLSEALHPRAIAAQTEAARGIPRLAFVDMTDRVCSAATCPVVQRGNVIFRDGDHLTASFSRAEAPALESRIVSALASMR